MPIFVSEKTVAVPQPAFGYMTKVLPSKDRNAFRIDVYDDPNDVLASWQELMAVAPATVYQTPGFVLPWLHTRGAEAGFVPKFVVQRSFDGTAQALFCFGLKRFGLFNAAVFAGGKDSNFNIGLFRPGFAPDRSVLAELLRTAARKMGSLAPDVFLLYDQPLDWNGWPNPLAALPRQMSPSFAYKANVGSNAEAYFATKISKDSRKKLRKKETRLAEIGTLTHLTTAKNADAKERIVEAFFEQKIARFDVQKIESGFTDPEMRHFVEAAMQPCQDDQDGQLEFHALQCGQSIVAVYGGATHRGHFSAFFNSFNSEPEIAKSSPGDLLLLKLIAAKCKEGVTTFDLGIGEARYKDMICNETVSLFDSFVPVTWKGWIVAMVVSRGLRFKRALKQNEKAFKIARRIRALLRHKA